MKNKPLLSICLISYNQEAFILDALKGVAMQEVDFDFELLVADDCSTDRTLSLIRSYLPESGIKEVRFLERPANLGMQRNWHDALSQAQGKYIALLEGDDYWTDRHKLQMQIDFLEKNPRYAGCFHNTEERHENPSVPSVLYCQFSSDQDVDIRILSRNNVMPTCSLVFRILAPMPMPDWFFTLKMVDWPFSIMNAKFGPYHYMPKVMGVHRLHASSAWSLQSKKDNLKYIGDAYTALCQHYKDDPVYKIELESAAAEFMRQQQPVRPGLTARMKNKLRRMINK